MSDPAKQGLRLRTARQRLGVTQSDASRRAGIPPQRWFSYERGKLASLDVLHKLATAIGADPHEIDPRLCPAPGKGPKTLTLVFEAYGNDPERAQLVGETDADTALLSEVLDELVGTITPKTVDGLIQAAALARVKLVVRTDLAPAMSAPEPAPTPKKGVRKKPA